MSGPEQRHAIERTRGIRLRLDVAAAGPLLGREFRQRRPPAGTTLRVALAVRRPPAPAERTILAELDARKYGRTAAELARGA